MNTHPTKEELLLFVRGGLRADRVGEVMRHLRECSECLSSVMPEEAMAASVEGLVRDIDPASDEHPPFESALTPFAEGKLTGAAARDVEAHLQTCETCRQDVDDIRAMASLLSPRRSRTWLIAAAVAAAIAIAAMLLLRREPEPTDPVRPPVITTSKPPVIENPPHGYGREEWTALVKGARSGTTPAMPDVLKALRRADILRGPDATDGQLAPTGIVSKTARPEFRWPARKGATSTIIVFRGDDEVLRSESLTGTRWTPPRDLPRAVTYTWQVNLQSADGIEILPVARFHVLAAETLAEIETAERQHPNDHLLLGLLYARAGLDAEAREQLQSITDSRDAATAQRILRALDSWRRDSDSEGRP